MRLEKQNVILRIRQNEQGLLIEMAFWIGAEDTEWYPMPLTEAERIKLARVLTSGLGYRISKRKEKA